MSKPDPIYVYIEGNGLAAENHRAAFEELNGEFCVVDRYEIADVIDICTPTDNHLLPAVEALNNNKAVFVEKPTCRTLKEAVYLLQVEEAAIKRIGAGENDQLVYPISQFSLADADPVDSLGVNYKRDELYYSSSKWRGTWAKAGGGALFTHGWHVIQALISNMEDSVVSVACDLRNMWHDIEVEDYALVRLTDAAGNTFTRQIATAPFDLGHTWEPSSVLGDSHELLVKSFTEALHGEADPYNMTDACWMMMLITACYYSAYISKPVVLNDLLRDPKTHPFFAGWQQQFVQRQLQSVSSH